MNLLVLGATGRVGRRFCAKALRAGHTVRAYSRSVVAEGDLEGVEAVQADVLDRDRLGDAITGVDAVVSSIGMDRGSDFPWAPIRVPRDIHSTTAQFLVEQLERRGPKRLVMVSAHGVGDSWQNVPLPVRALIGGSNIGVAYRDLDQAEQALARSNLAWTAVRPTVLADGEGTGEWKAARDLKAGLFARIPRGDVAEFLLQEVEHTRYPRQRISVTGA